MKKKLSYQIIVLKNYQGFLRNFRLQFFFEDNKIENTLDNELDLSQKLKEIDESIKEN